MCEMCRGYLGVFDQMVCDLSLGGFFVVSCHRPNDFTTFKFHNTHILNTLLRKNVFFS